MASLLLKRNPVSLIVKVMHNSYKLPVKCHQNVFLKCVGNRSLYISYSRRGLEEFFPKTQDEIEEGEATGRPWGANELRHKSFEDLHKLWYVLLKERNMLLTLEHEANRQGFIMPAPERIKKVAQSMARIKMVIGERERAVKQAKNMLDKMPLEDEQSNKLTG